MIFKQWITFELKTNKPVVEVDVLQEIQPDVMNNNRTQINSLNINLHLLYTGIGKIFWVILL